MDPKTIVESRISPVPPGDLPVPELEVWDPPFERWMKIADALLGRTARPLAKVISRELRTPPLKH